MIAAWMLYCALCALGLSLAAVLAERALLAGRGPVRHVWLAAVILSLIVPALAYRYAVPRITDAPVSAGPDFTGDEPAAGGAQPVSPPRVGTISPSPARPAWRTLLTRADQPLTVAWAVLSGALALHFLTGFIVLARTRRKWRPQVVLGVPVFVSERTGPALFGAVSPAIVVPEWALALTSGQLALMLRHEQEHQRARDGQLLFAAQLALIVMPWNVALWWQVMRLRVAVELDCDARVLRDADARSYGNLLLEVVRPRPALMPMGATAFAERPTQLERRIRVMASQRDRALRGARTLAAFVALAAVAIAWIAPRPPARIQAPQPEPAPAGSRAPAASARDSVPAESSAPRTVTRNPRPERLPTPIATAPASMEPRVDSNTNRSTPQVRNDTTPRAGGPGRAMLNVPQAAQATLDQLFEGITLTPDQEAQARAVITRLMQEQILQQESARPAILAYGAAMTALRAERDSVLRALLTNDADRDTLQARLAPVGGRGGGRRSGAPEVQTPPGGARSGGQGGRSGGQGAALLDDEQLADAAFRRLFDGIVLTPDQETRARTAIARMQTEQRAFVPPRLPTLIARRPFDDVFVIEARSDSALMALLTSDADRQKLRARMVNPIRPPQ